jgi:hypothetical protein
MKLKEIIHMMEMDDPRTSIQQKFDLAKKSLISLSDEYGLIKDDEAKVMIDELIEKLQLVYSNNKVF